jgi:uncharacterized membrane protein YeaQ/YmgE (transglycosylase-associated protein family)
MLTISVWIVSGLIVGVVARFLMPGQDPGGATTTSLLGVVGALAGGFIGQALGLFGPGRTGSFVMATGGAVLVLFVYRALVRVTP